MRINLGFPHRLSADGTIDHDGSIVLVLSIAAIASSLPSDKLGRCLAGIRRMDLRTAAPFRSGSFLQCAYLSLQFIVEIYDQIQQLISGLII